LLPKYIEALGHGLEALRLSNIAQKNAEPEEEEPVEEEENPLDRYSRFPLPHVIGTPEFHEDENCGLFFLSDGKATFNLPSNNANS
jgi:hypothetical protein